MGQRVITECDMCNTQPKDGDVSGWRNVTVAPFAAAPLPGSQGMPPSNLEVPAQVVHSTALICHKASCLTRWAKEQNEAK